MIIKRLPYNKQYFPKEESIKFFIWMHSKFKEDNTTPQVHYMLIDHIHNPEYKKKVIECFRGFGKSTLMRYSIAYWLYLGKKPNFGEFNYILIIQKNVKMASSTIRTIKHLIETELQDVLHIERATFDEDPTIEVINKATGKRMVVKGRGSGQSLRGINHLGKRPNIIIFDDIEDEKEHSTPESRQKLKEWFAGAVLPAVDKNKYEYIFIGTPIHSDSLLMNLVNSEDWVALVLPVCDNFNIKDPSQIIPAWEDRFPPEEIISDYHNSVASTGSPKLFYQELLLEVTPSDALLYDKEKIRRYDYDDFLYATDRFTYYVTVDLATSEKQTADYTSIAVIGIDANMNWFLVDGVHGRFNPLVTNNKILEMAYKWNAQTIYLEDIGIGKIVESHLGSEMIRRGKIVPIDKIRRARISKIQVFKSFEPIVSKGKFFLPKEETIQSQEFKDFIKELEEEMSLITQDSILSKHDDVLDSIAQLSMVELLYIDSISEADYNALEEKSTFVNPYLV